MEHADLEPLLAFLNVNGTRALYSQVLKKTSSHQSRCARASSQRAQFDKTVVDAQGSVFYGKTISGHRSVNDECTRANDFCADLVATSTYVLKVTPKVTRGLCSFFQDHTCPIVTPKFPRTRHHRPAVLAKFRTREPLTTFFLRTLTTCRHVSAFLAIPFEPLLSFTNLNRQPGCATMCMRPGPKVCQGERRI